MAASVGIAGCSGGNENTPEPEGTSNNKSAGVEQDNWFYGIGEDEVSGGDNLAIQNSRLVRDENDSVGVTGDVKNTSGDVVFTDLQVEATLYDGNDEELDVLSDNTEQEAIDDLEPGEVWDFGIWFEDADLEAAASYSLSATGETGEAAGSETQTGTGNGTSTE